MRTRGDAPPSGHCRSAYASGCSFYMNPKCSDVMFDSMSRMRRASRTSAVLPPAKHGRKLSLSGGLVPVLIADNESTQGAQWSLLLRLLRFMTAHQGGASRPRVQGVFFSVRSKRFARIGESRCLRSSSQYPPRPVRVCRCVVTCAAKGVLFGFASGNRPATETRPLFGRAREDIGWRGLGRATFAALAVMSDVKLQAACALAGQAQVFAATSTDVAPADPFAI